MTPAALLGLLRLASPALPVGGFSYSEALEAAVERGTVHDEASAAQWLSDQLHLTQARAELPLLAAAHASWQAHDAARIEALNAWMLTTRESAELRAQTEQMGRSMTEWLRLHAADDARLVTLAALTPAPSWPIAFALATAQAGTATQAPVTSAWRGRASSTCWSSRPNRSRCSCPTTTRHRSCTACAA